MNNKYFEERKSLIEEIEFESAEFVSGGSGDDICDQYDACALACRRQFGYDYDEVVDCIEDCLDEFPCPDEMD